MTCIPHPATVTTARQMSQGGICSYLNNVFFDLSYSLSVENFMSKFLFLVREEAVGTWNCTNACISKTVSVPISAARDSNNYYKNLRRSHSTDLNSSCSK